MDINEKIALLNKFRWETIPRMYGCAHSSIIGFLSTEWINIAPEENSILDGTPSPQIHKGGRKGQKNADVLLCKNNHIFIPVEVETNVCKYMDKLNTLFDYINNNGDYSGIDFGLLIMMNNCRVKEPEGWIRYKHNWNDIKKYIKEKGKSIALISFIKERAQLKDSSLDTLRKRSYYYRWAITNIDYWIYQNNNEEKCGTLFPK